MTTALQTANFDFYGDSLIAVKDITYDEIYVSINSVLKGIGFSRDQTRYQRNKWIKDISVSKGVVKFTIPTNGGKQEAECINSRKLPIALAKINITKRMQRDYPEITDKLSLYQDKCADALAQIFIDKNQVIDRQTLVELTDTINRLNETMISMQQEITDLKESLKKPVANKKKFSKWAIHMFPKYQALMNYFNIDRTRLYRELFLELQNIYPDIDLNQLKDNYCQENKLDECFTLDVIENSSSLRVLFEGLVDGLLEKYKLNGCCRKSRYGCKTIFE